MTELTIDFSEPYIGGGGGGGATPIPPDQVGIDTRAYYSPPCHSMPAFASLVPPKISLDVTDRLSSRILSLPMGGHVTPAVAARVALAIREALAVPEPVVA